MAKFDPSQNQNPVTDVREICPKSIFVKSVQRGLLARVNISVFFLGSAQTDGIISRAAAKTA